MHAIRKEGSESAKSEATELADEWLAAARRASELIAPSWPLDQSIAVNPYWELRQEPAEDVAARVAALGGFRMLAPDAIVASAQALPIDERCRAAAAAEIGEAFPAGRSDVSEESGSQVWQNVCDLADAQRDLSHRMSWHEEIIDQISRFCSQTFASHRERGLGPGGLYSRWLEVSRQDRGIAILMGEPALARGFDALPETREGVLVAAANELGLETGLVESYAHALLLDVNGWASWIAYLRWQNRLANQPHDLMLDLLVIRMAWELVLWRHVAATDATAAPRLAAAWHKQQAQLPGLIEKHRAAQRPAWALQRGAELAYQEQLVRCLREAPQTSTAGEASLQAVFCIDVRSELVRRHLEAQDDGVQTLGFAGFFGLPMEFQSAGSATARPQLPGLLKPVLTAREGDGSKTTAKSRYRAARWKELAESPPAMFTLVETVGPLYALRLLRESLSTRRGSPEKAGGDTQIQLLDGGQALSLEARAALVTGILRAMGLDREFAPTVLLVAHGSSTANNAHAASLDCGACGGQSGEVNVRLLAQLLNDADLRAALRRDGIAIPEATRFVPALHDTTTEEVTCLSGRIPADARGWLDAASEQTRRERAAALGVVKRTNESLDSASRRRAQDWSEVRPEWGLAGNAAFLAAPRARTRGVDLGGRVFLHDYAWQRDSDGKILELILTAPVVVANWINTQYAASVADPVHLGSGSKLLHNVVGGNLGVFEGQGGDLRIGLPYQSVHDGDRWMHTPLRLSVYVETPREPMIEIYRRHESVRTLVDNNWLYLFRLDEAPGVVERLHRDTWKDV